jgi:response regulator RpfG family c-di-GMP phosphodiesterase
VVYQIASALAEAHKKNLVHRDIKPTNIRVTPDGQAKLLDFGLVRQGLHRMTEPGVVLGTLDYLAPEQARDSSSVDIRADIYGLGGTLFWCLSGETPFQNAGNFRENILRRLTQAPPSLRSRNSKVPAELDAVVARMMACNPDERYPTPQAAMNALLRFLKPESQEQLLFTSPLTGLTPDLNLPAVAEHANSLRRVLVVDDSRTSRQFCVLALQEEGIPCDEVADGCQALAALGARAYDLVLSDWQMPGMTGPELCRRIRCNPPAPNMKIILFSADVKDDEIAQVLASGADDYLTKAFSPVQLIARVKAALQLKESQDRTDLLNRHLLACNQQLEQSLTARDVDIIQNRNALVLGLADLVSCRDVETISHALRLQAYCRCLAEDAAGIPAFSNSIDANFIQMLECCAPLHDIGKVGLPDHILAKAGNWEAEERIFMQSHTILGAETLQKVAQRHGSAVAFLQMAIDIARSHHERFDGKGYPDRLAGNAIPLSARIFSVGDVYDGLRCRRTYKPALTHEAAMRLMLEESAGQFDPVLLQCFERCAPRFKQIFRDMPG